MAFTYHNQTDAYQSKQATELKDAHVSSCRLDKWSIQHQNGRVDLSNNVLEAAGKGKQEGSYLRAAYKLNDKSVFCPL